MTRCRALRSGRLRRCSPRLPRARRGRRGTRARRMTACRETPDGSAPVVRRRSGPPHHRTRHPRLPVHSEHLERQYRRPHPAASAASAVEAVVEDSSLVAEASGAAAVADEALRCSAPRCAKQRTSCLDLRRRSRLKVWEASGVRILRILDASMSSKSEGEAEEGSSGKVRALWSASDARDCAVPVG